MKRHLPNCIGLHDEKASKLYNFFLGYECAVSGIREVVQTEPTIDAIPVEWMREKMRGYVSALRSTETAALVRVMQMWQQEQEGK